MVHLRRLPVRGSVGGALCVLALLLFSGVAISETRPDPWSGQRAERLSEEEIQRLLDSGVSLAEARAILLEKGFPPDEVDALIGPLTAPEGVGTPPLPRTSDTAYTPDSAVRTGAALTGETPESPRASSRMEEPEAGEVPEETREDILPFGYRLFAQGPSSFTPPLHVPVGPDYVLGPDDGVVIHTWGATELSYTLTISPEGSVVIREMGVVYLSGMTLGEARVELQKLFEKFYPGIRVHVSVGQLRTLRVYVIGEVVQPGAYTLSSLSTVLTGLYYAGGPTVDGSLRQIRLIRDNREAAVVDLYRYLLEGDRSNDRRLENEDTIFIPTAGPRVAVRGEVRRPAVYEFLPGENLDHVLAMAGGVRATGYLERVQIDRIQDNEKHIILDIGSGPGESGPVPGGVGLADGDEVRVFPVLPGYDNAVWAFGSVKRPGRYELKPQMTLLDLVKAAEGLEGDAYLPRVQIERTEGNEQVRFLSPDLGGILRGTEPDVALAPKDSVRVFSVWDMKDREEVEIFGEIRRPGRYPLGANMTLRDLIFLAGGLRESAYLMRAEISRVRRPMEGDPRRSDLIPVRLTDVISEGSGKDSIYLLQAGDKVFIRRIPQWDTLRTVEITGEVRFPGRYALTSTQETLAEVFGRAGGILDDAFLEAAVLERKDEGRVVVDFPKAVSDRSERENLVLEDGDHIHVPRLPETVQVRGAVFQPSRLKFIPGKTAEYYIRKCGGYLDRADRGRVRVTRSSGAVVGSRRFWPDAEVERGDVIVVPFKEEKKEMDWEKIAQVTQVIAGLATTVYLLTEAYKK